jgi:hypothetical protein
MRSLENREVLCERGCGTRCEGEMQIATGTTVLILVLNPVAVVVVAGKVERQRETAGGAVLSVGRI